MNSRLPDWQKEKQSILRGSIASNRLKDNMIRLDICFLHLLNHQESMASVSHNNWPFELVRLNALAEFLKKRAIPENI